MSGYSLLYVDGISDVDTLYFDTLTAQNAYFSSLAVVYKEVSDSFFPPFYTNEITISSEDITLSSRVNYLKLDYQNKIYYYFIDDVEYKEGDLLKLTIRMDTIQTFMFNLKIDTGIIERKFIDRYDSEGNINRHYLRENVSKGEFVLDSKSYPTTNGLNVYHTFVCKSASPVWDNTTNTGIYYKVDNGSVFNGDSNLTSFAVPGYILMFPYSRYTNHSENQIYKGYDNVEHNTSFNDALLFLSKDPNVSVIYDFPFLPVTNITAEASNPNSRFTFDDNFKIATNPDTAIVGLAVLHDRTHSIHTIPRSIDINTLFAQNDRIGTAFSTYYMPMLLDENYMRLEWGEDKYSTTFPLFLSRDTTFTAYFYGNITDGSRYYSIFPTNDIPANLIDNKYNSIVCAGIANTIDLVTDTWETWKSLNKSTIAMAYASFACSALTSFSSTSTYSDVSYAREARDIDKYYSENTPRASKGRFMNPANSGRFQRGLSNLKDEYSEDRKLHSMHFVGEGSLLGTATSELNAFYAPSLFRDIGNSYQNLLGSFSKVHKAIYNVADFTYCAQYYHRTGYLVNEYVFSISNIFSYVHNRFYFNVLKMNNIDLSLSILQPSSVIDDIRLRLTEGIRLWDSSHSIGSSYNLDNVELSLI